MAYASSNVILDDHYNIFVQGGAVAPIHTVANLNSIWGVGNGNKGWGQPSEIAAVTAGDVITATQWSTLFARLGTIAAHENNTITGASAVTVGDTITAIATLAADITDVYTLRFDNSGNTQDATASAGSTSFNQFAYHKMTATFASGDAARYFFNSGGYLDITTVHSGGTVNPKDTEWADTASKTGTLRMTHDGFSKIGGGGTPVYVVDSGYYDLTTSWVSLYKQFSDSSPYTTNYIEIFARVQGTPGANADNGATIEFEIRYVDDQVGAHGDDLITGTLTSNMTRHSATTGSIANTWGVMSTFNGTQTAKT